MTDWNERIARAKKALFTGALWNGDQIDALLDMFNALKDPEPAKGESVEPPVCPKCGGRAFTLDHREACDNCGWKKEPEPAQPLVQHPDGRVWYWDQNHFLPAVIPDDKSRPMTISEAFRPGAIVRWTFGTIPGHIEGELLNTDDRYVRIIVPEGTSPGGIVVSHVGDVITLVKPAPEETP